jgi:hypothetical protein
MKEYKGQNTSLLEKLMNGIFKLDIVLRHELSKNAEKHIPSLNEFMYQCILNFARVVWKNPMLVYDVGVDKVTIQANKLKLEKLVASVIKDTFTYYLPFDIDDVVEEPEQGGNSFEQASEQEHETEVVLNTEAQHENEQNIVEEDVATDEGERIDECERKSDSESNISENEDIDESSVFDIETKSENEEEDVDDNSLDDTSQIDNEDFNDDGFENDDVDDVEISNQDEEPLIHDSHIPIPRYHQENLDNEHTSDFDNFAETIKNVYIDENPSSKRIEVMDADAEETMQNDDIKIVTIDKKSTNAIVDKVEKKNSLLAIKKKVKSQIFVEKRESKRINGASFF